MACPHESNAGGASVSPPARRTRNVSMHRAGKRCRTGPRCGELYGELPPPVRRRHAADVFDAFDASDVFHAWSPQSLQSGLRQRQKSSAQCRAGPDTSGTSGPMLLPEIRHSADARPTASAETHGQQRRSTTMRTRRLRRIRRFCSPLRTIRRSDRLSRADAERNARVGTKGARGDEVIRCVRPGQH